MAEQSLDPVETNGRLYRTVFENARVRVLEYLDEPGDSTGVHHHPDSVMITLSDFSRRISSGGREVGVDLTAGQVRWLDAQEHSGTNVGSTPTHTMFVELKEPDPSAEHRVARIGPSGE